MKLAPQDPFPPFVLTPEQERGCLQLVDSVLDETLREYDTFVHRQDRILAPNKWKPVWTRENVTVYKQQQQQSSLSNSVPPSGTTGDASASAHRAGVHGIEYNTHWPLPRLTCVGSIVGSLDDALFGVMALTRNEIRIRSSYINDELQDVRVLHQFQGPTATQPFQSVCLKWSVKNSLMAPVVRQRDSVYVERVGTHRLWNGERVGFIALHSVTLPQCPEPTPQRGYVRGQLMACYLYRAMPHNTVEVYAHTVVDPRGKVPRGPMVVTAIAKAVGGCWQNTWCGQNKKLTWMLAQAAHDPSRLPQQQQQQQQQQQGLDLLTTTFASTNSRACSLCTKSLAFRSLRCCSLCRLTVCSHCATLRKLPFITANGLDTESVRFLFCTRCITMSSQINAANIIRHEYVGGSNQRHHYSGGDSLDGHEREREPSFIYSYSVDSLLSPQGLSSGRDSWAENTESSSSGSTESLDVQTSDAWEKRERTLDHAQEQRRVTETTANNSVGDYQQQLWTRMTQLQVAAETAYQLTKNNDSAMAQHLRA